MVYADQMSSQSDLDRDYESYSIYAANLAKSVPTTTTAATLTDTPWDARRLADVASYLAKRIPESTRLLDAGCSSGTFLRFLIERGFTDVTGLDPSHDAVAIAMSHNGVRAYAGSFTSPPARLGKFAALTLSHTLEHIADVRGAVDSLRSLLAPGGIAYIEVPDAERYDQYLVAPFHDFNTEHINHFSLGVLKALMDDAGFDELDGGAKIIHCSERDEYPAIYGLWRIRAESRPARRAFVRDEALIQAAKRYIEASNARMHQIDRGLRSALADRETVIVWGAGQLSMKLLADTVLGSKRVAAIVDSSPQRCGMHIGSTEIVPPEALRDLTQFPIVVGSIHSEDSIVKAIKQDLSLPNDVIRLFREEPVVR